MVIRWREGSRTDERIILKWIFKEACKLNSNGQTGRKSTISDEFANGENRNSLFTPHKPKKD